MKRHTFYPETAALEMVARKVMGMETVAEARQHDSGKFANIRQTVLVDALLRVLQATDSTPVAEDLWQPDGSLMCSHLNAAPPVSLRRRPVMWHGSTSGLT